jgi:hypothetical protein
MHPSAARSPSIVAWCVAALLVPGICLATDFDSLGPWVAAERFPGPDLRSSRAPIVAITATDPLGDTFGSGTVQHDVRSFTLERGGTTLSLRLEFDGTISPAESLAPDALAGFIDLDVDQDPATGLAPAVDTFCPITPAGLGIEYVVELVTYSATTADVGILDASLTEIGRAPMTFGTSSVTIEIPLAVLGGDDGFVHTAAVVGPLLEPTDCVPDGTFLANSVVPAIPTSVPATLLLFGLLLVAMGWRALA